MERMQTIQEILLYSQIADTYVKLFLNICLVIAVIVMIKYICQRRRIEKEKHEHFMQETRQNLVEVEKVEMSPEEKMENMDA